MNNFVLVKGYLSSKATKFFPGSENKKAVLISQVGISTGTKDENGKKVYSWVPFKAFGKTAELISQHVQPGAYFEASGFIGMNAQYVDNNGVVHYPTAYICATEFSLLSGTQNAQTQTQQVQQPNVLQEAVL